MGSKEKMERCRNDVASSEKVITACEQCGGLEKILVLLLFKCDGSGLCGEGNKKDKMSDVTY